MDTASALRSKTARGCSQGCSPVLVGTTCPRCGGLMVGEFSMDLLNGTGELEFLASRCVQCGEVVDPVILKNRRIQQPSSTIRSSDFNESIEQGRTR